jgi:NAD-dependent dihydropyrimidine dehydrogenase PreA subunit
MTPKDLYEDLTRFYEFQLGSLPHRQEFKVALKSTFALEDVRIFFRLPFLGTLSAEQFEQKLLKAGISGSEMRQAVQRLVAEGMIDTYVGAKGRVYGRSPFIALIELQVRMKQDSPMRAVCSKVMDALIEGGAEVIPTRTPYYRVLAVESTLTGAQRPGGIALNAEIPDPRQVLPIDVVSKMVKEAEVIAVSDCYCRATKRLLGEDCGHPLETCFYFNELGLIKLETGYARRIDNAEALRILRQCEQAGLVHNVSNCEGKIQTLCNCCSCSCAVLKAVVRGQKNVAAPSRYQAVLAAEKCKLHGNCVEVCPVSVFSIQDGRLGMYRERCIGCGQCASACPEQALEMQPRQKPPRVYPDNAALFRKINMEAMVGLVSKKIFGK